MKFNLDIFYSDSNFQSCYFQLILFVFIYSKTHSNPEW